MMVVVTMMMMMIMMVMVMTTMTNDHDDDDDGGNDIDGDGDDDSDCGIEGVEKVCWRARDYLYRHHPHFLIPPNPKSPSTNIQKYPQILKRYPDIQISGYILKSRYPNIQDQKIISDPTNPKSPLANIQKYPQILKDIQISSYPNLENNF